MLILRKLKNLQEPFLLTRKLTSRVTTVSKIKSPCTFQILSNSLRYMSDNLSN